MSKQIGMSIDEFLYHQVSGGGRGANAFLGNWRKKDPPKITVWLHPQAGFVARWSHNWPRIVVKTDRDTGATRREVWGGQWVCHERELILRKQRFRDENDVREHPPEVCPLCKTIEVVRSAVASGEFSWTDPVFKFIGDTDADRETIITAGGMYNAFSAKDLSTAQKGDLRRAGIRVSEAWRENALSRCQYCFVVVDHAHPENGAQLTDEAESLGEAVKRAVRDKMDEYGAVKGNPIRTPYPFLWEYKAEEQFAKKYRVVPMSSIELTDEIKAVFEADPPDMESHIKPGNVIALRADMEKSALVELPWDDIFSDAERKHSDEPAPKAERVPEVREKLSTKKEDDFPPSWNDVGTPNKQPMKVASGDDELFVCDHCEFDKLKATDPRCPQCGTTYDADGNMVDRPCVTCKTLTPATGEANRTICPKCAAIHNTETWAIVEQVQSVRRSMAAAQPAEPPARRVIGAKPASDDKLPWGSK